MKEVFEAAKIELILISNEDILTGGSAEGDNHIEDGDSGIS